MFKSSDTPRMWIPTQPGLVNFTKILNQPRQRMLLLATYVPTAVCFGLIIMFVGHSYEAQLRDTVRDTVRPVRATVSGIGHFALRAGCQMTTTRLVPRLCLVHRALEIGLALGSSCAKSATSWSASTWTPWRNKDGLLQGTAEPMQTKALYWGLNKPNRPSVQARGPPLEDRRLLRWSTRMPRDCELAHQTAAQCTPMGRTRGA